MGWMPLGGLALANSLATFLEMTGLLVLMRRRLKGLEGRTLLAGLSHSALAVAGMSLLLGGWTLAAVHLRLAVYAVGGIALGGGSYAAILWLLRVPETRQVMRVARRQVARITSKAAGPTR
jgi:putative peptidoglycan lipid II flippase